VKNKIIALLFSFLSLGVFSVQAEAETQNTKVRTFSIPGSEEFFTLSEDGKTLMKGNSLITTFENFASDLVALNDKEFFVLFKSKTICIPKSGTGYVRMQVEGCRRRKVFSVQNIKIDKLSNNPEQLSDISVENSKVFPSVFDSGGLSFSFNLIDETKNIILLTVNSYGYMKDVYVWHEKESDWIGIKEYLELTNQEIIGLEFNPRILRGMYKVVSGNKLYRSSTNELIKEFESPILDHLAYNLGHVVILRTDEKSKKLIVEELKEKKWSQKGEIPKIETIGPFRFIHSGGKLKVMANGLPIYEWGLVNKTWKRTKESLRLGRK